MKVDKFKIANSIRLLIIMIDNDMDNFPKKDIELKNRIRTNSYDILELIYMANVETEIEQKKRMLLQVIAKVKVIDFLLNITFDKKIITQKKYCRFGEKIDDITRLTTGLIKSIQ